MLILLIFKRAQPISLSQFERPPFRFIVFSVRIINYLWSCNDRNVQVQIRWVQKILKRRERISMKGSIIGIIKPSRHSKLYGAPSGGGSAVAKMPQNWQLTVITLPRLDRLYLFVRMSSYPTASVVELWFGSADLHYWQLPHCVFASSWTLDEVWRIIGEQAEDKSNTYLYFNHRSTHLDHFIR